MDSTSIYHPFRSWWYGVSYLTALFELTSGNRVFSRSFCSLMKINEWKTWCWRWCVSIRPGPSSAIMMDAGNFLATWMLGPIEGWLGTHHQPPIGRSNCVLTACKIHFKPWALGSWLRISRINCWSLTGPKLQSAWGAFAISRQGKIWSNGLGKRVFIGDFGCLSGVEWHIPLHDFWWHDELGGSLAYPCHSLSI